MPAADRALTLRTAAGMESPHHHHNRTTTAPHHPSPTQHRRSNSSRIDRVASVGTRSMFRAGEPMGAELA